MRTERALRYLAAILAGLLLAMWAVIGFLQLAQYVQDRGFPDVALLLMVAGTAAGGGVAVLVGNWVQKWLCK